MKLLSCLRHLAVGVLISIGANSSVYAQEQITAKPHAFYIAEFVVTDREGMKPYSAQVESTFAPFSGRYIVRGGKINGLEGDGPKGGMVVIEFDSRDQAQAWYDSPAYRKLRPIRQKSAVSRVYIVDGTITPPTH
jgi:uncharacterized protein (DUF1330 family)